MHCLHYSSRADRDENIVSDLKTCSECGLENTPTHDLATCAQCSTTVELCGEGGFIYPNGSVLCPTCEAND